MVWAVDHPVQRWRDEAKWSGLDAAWTVSVPSHDLHWCIQGVTLTPPFKPRHPWRNVWRWWLEGCRGHLSFSALLPPLARRRGKRGIYLFGKQCCSFPFYWFSENFFFSYFLIFVFFFVFFLELTFFKKPKQEIDSSVDTDNFVYGFLCIIYIYLFLSIYF